MDKQHSQAFDLAQMPWLEVFNEHSGTTLFDKRLVSDERTGMQINISKYPAGYVTTWHTHPHSHGMYVIEGDLYTNLGIVKPGNFVWFPEGEVMEHGATPDEPCTVVFVTNAPFAIDYVEAPEK